MWIAMRSVSGAYKQAGSQSREWMLVPVQGLDLYEHFRPFLLVWAPPMDLYGRA